jgi:hypothetical protein
MMVAGITGGILAHEHHVGRVVRAPGSGVPTGVVYTGWSTTAYDVVRIGSWALLIFGAIIVAFALVREFRARA